MSLVHDMLISQGNDIYSTTGNANTTKTFTAPLSQQPTCFVRAISSSCDNDQWLAVANKEAVIFNGVVYKSADDFPKLDPLPPYPPPPKSPSSGNGGPNSGDGAPKPGGDAVSGAIIKAPSLGALILAIVVSIALE